VVFANYAFDVWPQDLFRIQGGKLQELLVTLKHRGPTPPDLSAPDILGRLIFTEAYRPIGPGYYGDPEIDRILESYAALADDTILAMPIAGLTMVRRLFDLAGRRLLLISSDKAFTHEEQLSGLDMRAVQLHGASFSMTVNYHAIGRFFEEQGGLYAATSPRPLGVRTACFLLGGDPASFGDTRLAFRQQFDELAPAELYPLYASQQRECKTIHLDHFLGLLRLSRWDPLIVSMFDRTPREEAHEAPEELKRELSLALERVWENFFLMERDLPFELARFALALKRPLDAIRYGRASLELFGEHPVTLNNLGIAHHYAGDRAEALRCFERASALAPGYATPRRWRERLLASPEWPASPSP
jgi:hypothetical protein